MMKEHIMITQHGFRAKLKSHQHGAVAIIVAICLTLLIGMIGLVVDLGHMFIIKTELQNAADSCALAAARELDGTAESLERAENAGITVGQRNNVDLQNDVVSILASDVTFSENLSPNSSYLSRAAGASASSKYVMCTLRRSGIAMWFMQVLGFGNQAVGSRAVAAIQPSQTSCAIPLGLCKPPPPAPTSCAGGGAPDSNGMCVGDWLSGRFDAGGGSTGSFNWIDFSPPAGGASELASILEGSGQCNLSVTAQVGEPGALGNSAARAWNSRFGLYQSGNGNPNLSSAAPDFTGYSYTTTPAGQAAWPAQRNAFSDFLTRRSSHVPYQGNASTGLNIGIPPYSSATVSDLTTAGANRRLAVAPVVDCAGWGGTNHQATIINWACILMLHPIDSPGDIVRMEYRGLSNLANSPCATFGIPGGTAGPLVAVLVQ
jgi:hypothetical protein